ncbi:PD-(D/E)XK motif protein [Chelativorans sp. M5D2P16]|uniref:PD-(D/E)XK motif protein n=1 Tax=Chelativorans sp. M5D2P16 TaxID=3095678 RepID=UPI002AC9F832|nr:PD-(D/E)XK motif protein [Chelativorans sp. M5D2P16]MDZ5698642.1 PD-(D/E)XK motif protein [Chelativorans sp. M5D2P16]
MTGADWQQTLRAAWEELGNHVPQARQYRTRRLPAIAALNVHAGIRAVDNAPCLVIDAYAPADALFELGGMRLAHTRGDEGALLVLSLEDVERLDLFATVCADMLQAAAGAPLSEGLEVFLARLAAWRRFLRESRAGLSRNETVGLIGELTVLRRLIEHNAQLLSSWAAPEDGLHDFTLSGHALEIKATLGPATVLSVSSLDQLDTGGLRRLDLLHVRLVEAPDGECLEQMIGEINDRIPSEATRRAFENALLRRGLIPDDMNARSAPRVIIRNLSGFTVDAGFPRLVRASVPSAVTEANYRLELSAIERHAIEAEAVLAEFARGI